MIQNLPPAKCLTDSNPCLSSQTLGPVRFAFLGAKPMRVLDFHPPQQGLDFILKSSTKVFAVKFVKVIFKWDNDLK